MESGKPWISCSPVLPDVLFASTAFTASDYSDDNIKRASNVMVKNTNIRCWIPTTLALLEKEKSETKLMSTYLHIKEKKMLLDDINWNSIV